MTGDPRLDVVVAVHTAERPIRRAVESVLAHNSAELRVTVVCHNIPVETIAGNLGELADDGRVRLLRFDDDTRSPAGPFNHGLDAATAEFTSVLGSDDELQPGAIDSWFAMQRRDSADVVIPRLAMSSGRVVTTPPTRLGRTRNLNGVADRLAYRTAQLGLVSRAAFPGLRFTEGLRTGEDIAYGLRLWFSGARIGFDRRGPAYLIHDEAGDRTSASLKPVADDFAFLDAALDPTFTSTLDDVQRESIAVKLLRTHVLDAIVTRRATLPADAPELARVIERLHAFAPTAAGILGRRDSRIIEAVATGRLDEALQDDIAVRTDFRRASNLLPASPPRLLHREAPLRFLASLALAR